MPMLAVVATALTLAAAPVGERTHAAAGSAIAASPQWDKIKSLVGEWDGYAVEGDRTMPSRVEVRLTGDGSALMHWLDKGTPHEMVTMFHMDGDSLMATHYCSAHNQPRFVATPGGDPARIAFTFKDGTNIHPGDAYMKRVVIVFVDADHHDEEWTFDAGGQGRTGVFHFTRVKK
jgi:hypothetical protein